MSIDLYFFKAIDTKALRWLTTMMSKKNKTLFLNNLIVFKQLL
jgi:hypothetical protein